MDKIAISDLLIYGLTCVAIPAIICGVAYVLYTSRKASRSVSFFQSTGEKSMETAQKELELIEEVVALQRETNLILREMMARIGQGQQSKQ
jgi:hypothetical protein